jgi:hypothetical protein
VTTNPRAGVYATVPTHRAIGWSATAISLGVRLHAEGSLLFRHRAHASNMRWLVVRHSGERAAYRNLSSVLAGEFPQ